ncbi:DUF885 family protein [Henriciella sp. AS95]|uniref:DUF885 domain-containing protein n=1 Tax=Henriciella sp. AS95 TaxID=3135782 RepID=UPI00317FAD34
MSFPAKNQLCMLALATTALTACSPPVNEDGIARRTVQEIEQTFRDTAFAELALSPETASRLGLEETRIGQTFQDKLDDRSQARFERKRLLRLEMLERLNATPTLPDDSRLARHLEIIRSQYEALTRLESYGFGRYELGLARPYAVDQLSGAWVDVPDLLISSQPLGSYREADDFLARLDALPGAIADEERRLVSDAANGVIPPRFVLDRLEQRLRQFANEDLETHPLIRRFDSVISGLGSDEDFTQADYSATARRLMSDRIFPAYLSFADKVAELKLDAPDAPRLEISSPAAPSGQGETDASAAYYRDILAFYTEDGVTPDFLHDEGLAAIADIQAEIDNAFAAIGLTDGSVVDRLRLLTASPGQIYADDQEGRDQVLERLRQQSSAASEIMPRLLESPPTSSLVITRMPAYKEDAFAGASYIPAAANGSSPALFQINLADLTQWPDFTLATLLHHEGIPGHHIESASVAQASRMPLLRQMIWNTAYGEGWAVYAEDLADGAGLYAGDPLGRIGYLQSILLRAARLVVDTGIHSQGWSFDQAVTYLTDTTGFPREAMEEEVARYAVWPGQASAYFYGRNRILDMRDRAEAVLTGRFTEQGFNSALLRGGPRPLSMVEKDIEAWYAERLEQ